MAILLDELYSEVVTQTKKLKVLLKKATIPADQGVLFEMFVFDPEFNKKEELYIVDLKKNSSNNSFKPYAAYLHEYQTVTSRHQNSDITSEFHGGHSSRRGPTHEGKALFITDGDGYKEDEVPLTTEEVGENYKEVAITKKGKKKIVLNLEEGGSENNPNKINLEIQTPHYNSLSHLDEGRFVEPLSTYYHLNARRPGSNYFTPVMTNHEESSYNKGGSRLINFEDHDGDNKKKSDDFAGNKKGYMPLGVSNL